MKINVYISTLTIGGSERVCITLIDSLVKKKFDVELILLKPPSDSINIPTSVLSVLYCLNIGRARNSFFHIAKSILIRRPDVVLVFNHQICVVIYLIKFLLGLNFKIIARNISNLVEKSRLETSPFRKTVQPYIVKFVFNRINCIVCQSAGMANQLTVDYKIDQSKIRIINNPIPNEFQKIQPQLDLLRRVNKNQILFVGRLHAVKGFEHILNVFEKVLEKNSLAKLIIAGEGPYRDKLENMISQRGLNASISLVGNQKEIKELYLCSAVTILASIYEGFPNVLVESISLGTPIVSFDINFGPSEIIEENVNGHLIPFGDTELMAEKILGISTSPINYKQIVLSSRRYDNEKIVQKYIGLINEV